jgi:hypothetical protein
MVKTIRNQINCKFESSSKGCLRGKCDFRHWKGVKRNISDITVSPQKETDQEDKTVEEKCVDEKAEHDSAVAGQDDHLLESSSFPWEKTLEQGG